MLKAFIIIRPTKFSIAKAKSTTTTMPTITTKVKRDTELKLLEKYILRWHVKSVSFVLSNAVTH